MVTQGGLASCWSCGSLLTPTVRGESHHLVAETVAIPAAGTPLSSL